MPNNCIKVKEIVYKTGGLSEIRRYKRPVAFGNTTTRVSHSSSNNSGNSDSEKNKLDTLNKKRNSIKRLANSNRSGKDVIGSFTFEPFITDEDAARKIFDNFLNRLKYRNNNILKYIWAMERHKYNFDDDLPGIHFHSLFFEWPDIKETELQDIWGLGTIYVSDTSKIINLGVYFVNYVTKVMDNQISGRSWGASQNLRKPEKVLNEEYSCIEEEDILFSSLPRHNDYYGEIQCLYVKS